MRRVVVTGLGAVTPLGLGVRKSWTRLLEGHTATVNLVKERGDHFDKVPSKVAGLVPAGSRRNGLWQWSDWGDRKDASRMAKFTQFAIAAADEAIRDADCMPKNDAEREAMGVSIGSGIGSFEDVYKTSVAFEEGGYRKVSPLFVPRLLINLAAGHVAMRFGLRGPNTSPTSACTTGAHAIGDAARFIAFGDADIMLAGAAESCIHPLALAGFARARSLATAFNDRPLAASRPFDRDRDGFVMGEGSGILVLEEYERAKARKAKIYSEILGYGLSCDAGHMTSPLADGHGAALAMRRAMKQARVEPADVDYVNAHATGTLLGDIAEARAIGTALLGSSKLDDPSGGRLGGRGLRFKQHARDINLSSMKGAIGHLLGAAGAVEALFTVLSVHEGLLPPTANLDHIDTTVSNSSAPTNAYAAAELETNIRPQPQTPDYAESVSEQSVGNATWIPEGEWTRAAAKERGSKDEGGATGEGEDKGAQVLREANFVARQAQEKGDLRIALTNSFGFGGTNATLCCGKVRDA